MMPFSCRYLEVLGQKISCQLFCKNLINTLSTVFRIHAYHLYAETNGLPVTFLPTNMFTKQNTGGIKCLIFQFSAEAVKYHFHWNQNDIFSVKEIDLQPVICEILRIRHKKVASKTFFVWKFIFMFRCTVCPRSLVHFNIVSLIKKLDKTCWTYSMNISDA